jgi:membrane-bound metal-dependent hydrolase YbcI (DUF457 family)
MPLPISHGFLGATIVAAIHPKIKNVFAIPLFVGGIIAIVADFDFMFAFPTHDFSWHRGFSHSFLFSFFVFLAIAVIIGKERIRESIAYGLAYLSHPILDYMTTTAGKGLEIFWFFSSERYMFGWRGLSEDPLSYSIMEVFQSICLEFIIFFPLFAIIFCLRKYYCEF